MIVAGMMSGTSVDAIDVAICRIEKESNTHRVTLLSFYSKPIEHELRSLIFAEEQGVEFFSDLEFLIAREYAEAFNEARAESNVEVEVIGAHGQTVFHKPPISTYQALSGSALSALTQCTVVNDFRAADVALGGQGAPLVPIFDVATLRGSVPRIALNIGGMANITVLAAANDTNVEVNVNANIIACDTGPGNCLIDAAIQMFFGKQFDEDGRVARAGVVMEPLLRELKEIPYFHLPLPKSTGRELFNNELVARLSEKHRISLRPSEDAVATFTELTAWSIAEDIKRYGEKGGEVIVSGGGARNSFLLERLQSYLPEWKVLRSDDVGIPTQAKEAMAFAYLAWRTMNNLPSNIPSITGASKAVVLGSVSRSF